MNRGIEGVIVRDLTTHCDERGFFREIVRFGDIGFIPAQSSHAVRVAGVVNGWHIHRRHDELFFVVQGVMRLCLKDCRDGYFHNIDYPYDDIHGLDVRFDISSTPSEYQEIVLSEYEPRVAVVPRGVAHGYVVLSGPCHIVYWATETYDTSRHDEGRIKPSRWGIDWMRNIEIR